MSFMKMVSMRRTPEEKLEERDKIEAAPVAPSLPEVPWGLQICLCGPELDKLGIELDEDVQIGDMIHISGFAQVTAIERRAMAGQPDNERLELSIVDLAVENESTEDGGGDDEKAE